MLSLPYRFGGLGLLNPVEKCAGEYEQSLAVTEQLKDLIFRQDLDISGLDKDIIKETKKEMKAKKEKHYNELLEAVSDELDEKGKRLLSCAKEKGDSSWLSALPIRKFGYSINKQEFKDAVNLRYGWKIADLPAFCGCGSRNGIDHTLVCKKGGYVSMRHNALRDLMGKMMEEVCKDVVIEPILLPVDENEVEGNTSENARLDIAARGVWRGYERTFFDVRVTHPTANSHMKKSLENLYRENEDEKKRLYGERVRNS